MDAYLSKLWNRIKNEHKLAFLSTFITGLVIHLPVYLMDVPNHDGLASMYFDQNMITSGRWLLGLSCSVSSYFTLPWLIGLLSLFWVSVAAVLLTELLQPSSGTVICLVGMLLVSFPALASTYAYIFTADGYMLGLVLAIGAVLCAARLKNGYLWGAICLACSLGIYQSYLPFTMLLCLFMVLGILLKDKEAPKDPEIWKKILPYPVMGVLGFVLYEIVLHILLLLQGKVLDTYQGISSLEGSEAGVSVGSRVLSLYRDFAAFTFKGQVLFHNPVSVLLVVLLTVVAAGCGVYRFVKKGYYKKRLNYVWLVLFALLCPICTNAVLLISPGVTYHLLMRYQWVLYPIFLLVLMDRCMEDPDAGRTTMDICRKAAPVICAVTAFGLVIFYGVTNNIAYSNLEKKYEKTYAYCLRLADRMEQTKGYYQGIPVAMIGVVSKEAYPVTDITQDVTANMIGMTGDYLVYTSRNYAAFFKHYLGITINPVSMCLTASSVAF